MYKIGRFAQSADVTVRTLHYYEEIGLLSADGRTESGHRLYGRTAALRLQQIQSLTALGFTLEQVGSLLADDDYDPAAVIADHLAVLRREIDAKSRLAQRLEVLGAGLRVAPDGSTTSLVELLEVHAMFEKYYTPEQQQNLAQRAEAIGPEGLAEAGNRWHDLITRVRAAMTAGHAPEDEAVAPLAREWRDLIEQFTGGDPGTHAALGRLYQNEGPTPAQQQGFALDREIMAFMGKAVANLN